MIMTSSHAKADLFMSSAIDHDRAGLPFLGFALGVGISVAAWSLVGSVMWLLLG